MGRDEMKSASLHSFHEEHVAPTDPFQQLVRGMLEQLGEDPKREGLREPPARVEASLKWLTRGYQMDVEDVIGDAILTEKHENMICVRDTASYSPGEHTLFPVFGAPHAAAPATRRAVG